MRHVWGLVVAASAAALLLWVLAAMCSGQGAMTIPGGGEPVVREYYIGQPDGTTRKVDRRAFEAFRLNEPIREGSHICIVCKGRLVPTGEYAGKGFLETCQNPQCPRFGIKVYCGFAASQADCPSCQVPRQPQWQAPRRPMGPIPQAPSAANPAVCRVRAVGRGGSALGSGTLIDVAEGRGLVVTAAHVLRGTGPEVICEFPNGRKLNGQGVVDKDKHDIAAILIADPGVRPVEVATEGPRLQEYAASAGYGSTNSYLENRGFVTKIHGTQFEISGRARGGDSGGPVFDRRGRLIGVLWGTDGRMVIATSSVTTDGFLQRAGRYLLPYRRGQDGRLDGIQGQIDGLQNQPPPQIIMPPQQGQCPVVDLTPLQLEVSRAHTRIDKVVEEGQKLAEKYDAKIPGIAADVKAAVDGAKTADGKAVDAKTAVDEALDEDNPKGIFGRIKERVASTILGRLVEKYGFWAAGAIGLGLFLIYRDVKKRVTEGDPLLIEKVLARLHGVTEKTETTLDDRVVGRLESVVNRLGDRLEARFGPKPPAK